MHSHRWMLGSVLAILFAMQSAASNAEPRIGTAASTRPTVEAVAGGNTQKLSAGSEIYANQTVRTGNRGMADLVFLDSTNLNVGPRFGWTSSCTIGRALRAVLFCRQPAAPSDLLPAHKRSAPTNSALRTGLLAHLYRLREKAVPLYGHSYARRPPVAP